ncbi:MAG: BMP family ABC transporter substrate-binding protein [Actinomycetales bacterium]|nr:BMP family ABC transporter substrate-binding protein [Actinomycetales bacterium]
MFKGLKVATLVVAGALALAACGSTSGGGSSSSTSPAASDTSSSTASACTPSNIKVGMAYDIGGRGDKSFNDSAAAGLDKAVKELCVTSKELSAVPNETDAQKAARLTLLAKGGYNPIIAVGFAYAPALKLVAPKYPQVNFAIVDDSSYQAANVANLTFAANEASYLVGVIAAQATKKKSVGYIGGVNVPLLVSFQKGFDAGVTATDSSVKITDKYLTQPPDFSGFNAPDKGKATAAGMFDAGADVVYAAAGGSGGGVFVAAKAAGTWAIGVDSDQYTSADAAVKDVILTSALKNVDVAVYDVIDAAVKGSPLTGVQVYNLKNDGVGYSKSNPAVQPFEAKADAAAQAIIAGTVTVPN